MANALTYQSEFTGQQMDERLTAVATLTAALEALTAVVAQKYVKPSDGIPSTDMTAAVQASLAKAESAVQSLADYYTKTEVDQLLAAINGMNYVDVSTLPTAGAGTMGKIYLLGPDASGYYAYYYTSYDGTSYSWVGPLGTTEISLSNYATKAELGQLDQEVNGLNATVTGWEAGYVKTNQGVGETVTLSRQGSSPWRSTWLDVDANCTYIVNGEGGDSPRLWCFIDSSNKILTVAAAMVTSSNNALKLTPPSGAAKLVLNSSNSDSCYVMRVGMKDDVDANTAAIAEIGPQVEYQGELVEFVGSKTEYGATNLISGFWNLVAYMGQTMPDSPGQVGGWNCLAPIAVKKGYEITIKTLGGANGRAWGFADVNKKLYANAVANLDVQTNGVTLVAPKDGYIYINYHTETATKPFYAEVVINKVKLIEDAMKEDRTPRIFNPPASLRRDTLKVLDIGNSFTSNAVDYVPQFATADGLSLTDMCVYIAVYSGGTFKDWYDTYHDDNAASYILGRGAGNMSVEISGTAGVGDGSLFRGALKDVQWDVILIHQSSPYSAEDFDEMEADGAGGYLKQFVRIIKTLQPSATIGFLLAHIPNALSPEIIGSTKRDTAARFAAVADVSRTLCEKYDIDFVVPVGSAIENLRASSLNTTNYNFTKDGTHLADGLGKYVAGATYYQTIFGTRYGKTVYGSSFNTRAITDADTTGVDEAYLDDFIGVTASNAKTAQMCAALAVNDMWAITNPDNLDL